MYRRSKINRILLSIREEMAAEADFDVGTFVRMLGSEDTAPAVENTEAGTKPAEVPAESDIAA